MRCRVDRHYLLKLQILFCREVENRILIADGNKTSPSKQQLITMEYKKTQRKTFNVDVVGSDLHLVEFKIKTRIL